MRRGEEDFYISDSDRMRPLFYGNTTRRPMANLIWQQFAMPRIAARGKYDALFVPAGNRRMPFWTPCPRIGTFMDLAIRHVPGKYDRIHSIYNLRVLPLLVRRLSLVLTISESTKRDLVEYVRVPADRIVVTPLAADKDRYFPREGNVDTEKIVERYGLRAPYILYISRIEHPGKNHVRLIKAFESLKASGGLPHQLVLAGSDWSGADEVHRAANSSSCKDDIVFTGFVPTEDLPDLYGAADIFVFPSLFEGFGLPILEAMACGVPVACSSTSSMPEVAGDAAVLFEPTNEKAIEEAIRSLTNDEQLRKEYSRRGLEQSGKFSWKKTATQTVEAIRGAVETGKNH